MQKTIITLDGSSAGKTKFIETIKEHGYWCWNINPLNVLSLIAHKLGWDGTRDKNYYEWLEVELSNANKYFNFEHKYVFVMVDKFDINERVQVLIVHNTNEDVIEELQEALVDKFYTILITDNEVIDDSYDKTLNYKNPLYIEDVLGVMETLTKSFGSDEVEEFAEEIVKSNIDNLENSSDTEKEIE